MKKIYLLTIGICFMTTLLAQSPGGVSSGLQLWLKADASSTLTLGGSSVGAWTYFNNSSNSFTTVAGTAPTLVTNAINGLPGVSFNGAKMDGPTGANAPIPAGSEAYSVFAVWKTASAASPQRPWTQWDSTAGAVSGNGTSLWLYNPGTGLEWGDQPEISPYTQGVSNPVTTGTFYLSEMNLLNATSNDLELTDQTNFATGPTVLSTGNGSNARANLSTVAHSLGSRENPTDEPFNGTLAELIVYSNSVSAGAARNQIFSYLSMKYGIPIGAALVSSAGTTVWDGNATYSNDVFGLAVDNTSGLNVQSSNPSTTAGVSGAGNMTVAPYGTLSNDQSFLMIGHDNGALTETTTNVPSNVAAGSKRLARTWEVQNTNSVGPVNIAVDFTGLTVSGSVATDFRLVTTTTSDPTFASPTGLYTPVSYTGNVATFNGVVAPAGSSLFAIVTSAASGTPLPVNFISFTAQSNGGDVDLNWVVGNNEQASNYVVQRSSDGTNYTNIGEVANSVGQTNYSFVDASANAGTDYYRVLETDQNGESIYSKVATVAHGAGDFSIRVLNNPSVGITEAQLEINAISAGKAFVELWSAGGNRINLSEQPIGTGPNTISIPMASLPGGSYVVKVTVGNVTRTVQVVKL